MMATLAPATAFTAALATLTPIRRAHAELHAASPWPWNASELVDGWWLDGFAGVRAFPADTPAQRLELSCDCDAHWGFTRGEELPTTVPACCRDHWRDSGCPAAPSDCRHVALAWAEPQVGERGRLLLAQLGASAAEPVVLEPATETLADGSPLERAVTVHGRYFLVNAGYAALLRAHAEITNWRWTLSPAPAFPPSKRRVQPERGPVLLGFAAAGDLTAAVMAVQLKGICWHLPGEANPPTEEHAR